MVTVFFSACSFFFSNCAKLKNKSKHSLMHTHSQLPFSTPVLNMVVSFFSPTLHMCKYVLVAQVPPQPTSRMLPSWPARPHGFRGGNQMIKGRNSTLLTPGTSFAETFGYVFPT